MNIYSTKSFLNFPCAHAQWFDVEPDGSPGSCADFHGYDRSFHFKFGGDVDEHGWMYPFGELKEVKSFLEYYFDHTSLLPANDKRVKDIPTHMLKPGGILGTLRVLPFGVSMEMTSLFVWEHVNNYILRQTSGRVYVAAVEVKEHERNSGIIEVSKEIALQQLYPTVVEVLPKCRFWEYESPRDALRRLKIIGLEYV